MAKNKIKDFDGSKVNILFADDFALQIIGKTEKPWTEDSLKIKLNGNADAVWIYDPKAIVEEIKGQNKSIIDSVLVENKNSIMQLDASITPSWKKSFPGNAKKIKIIDTISGSML